MAAMSEIEARRRMALNRVGRISFAAMTAVWTAATAQGAIAAGSLSNRPLTLTSG
jgi:hypothetical protein